LKLAHNYRNKGYRHKIQLKYLTFKKIKTSDLYLIGSSMQIMFNCTNM
jgi:hypothetical protein